MSLLIALLAAGGPATSPEIEAVMGHRKPRAERRMQARPGPASLPVPDAALSECADEARRDAAAALVRARAWIARMDGPSAQQCLGLALAANGQWREAATAFGAGAAAGEGRTAARLWAQAGNAAMVGGDPATARASLDRALTDGALPDGLEKGEAYLDRARARVAMKDDVGARGDLDAAIRLAPADPLAWLLSATLARRMDDLTTARRHIDHAVRLAPDDASVALEQGVVAALMHNDASARDAFNRARLLARGGPVGEAASAYLAQLPAPPSGAVAPQSR